MKHLSRKPKFGNGKDANDMLFRKLCYNFFTQGTITITHQRAKALKSLIDRLVSKTSERTESNKNYILRYIQDKNIINALFEKAGPVAQKTRGGYVTITRKHIRSNDGSQMSQLTWAHGITLQEPKKEEKVEKKAPKKAAPKAEKKEEAKTAAPKKEEPSEEPKKEVAAEATENK